MKTRTILCAAVMLGATVVNTGMAMDQGDWLIRAGVTNVDPKSNNHDVVSVDSATSVTFNFTYMMTANWGVEVLAAYPFEHDIYLVDGPKVGSTKHLPPTVSLQYHFAPASTFQPYVGFGVNYTYFFSENTTGALQGVNLNLDDSWGLAGEVGADIMLNEQWFLNLSARWIDIDTKAKLDGEELPGTIKIDPFVYGANIGFRF
ncbi:MAG: OmpW family outer membrane protein [Lysobacterales bacterium]